MYRSGFIGLLAFPRSLPGKQQSRGELLRCEAVRFHLKWPITVSLISWIAVLLFQLFLLTLPNYAMSSEIEHIPGSEYENSDMESVLSRAAYKRVPDNQTISYNYGFFGDTNLTAKSRDRSHASFYLGEFDFYASTSYGDRLNLLIDIGLDPQEDDDFRVELERVWIGYTFNDLLTIRAGRHHAPLGYWNKTFHHGRHLFVSVDRPFFLKFEHSGGVIPMHMTGLEAEGRHRLKTGMFRYEAGIGNGPKIDAATGQLRSNSFSDDNSSKQVNIRLSFAPDRIPGLLLGASGAFFSLNTPTAGSIDQRIYAVDVRYLYGELELLAEYFFFKNSVSTASAYYVQASRSGVMERFTPYARFERLDTAEDDSYFQDLSGRIERYQAIAGVRYDLDPITSSIKAQLRYDDTLNGNDFRVIELQWSFGF